MVATVSVEDHLAIVAVLNGYADACDSRRWERFYYLFTLGARFDYGGEVHLSGVPALVKSVSSMLDGCGETQHLLGNYMVWTEDRAIRASCKVRAFHRGAGQRSSSTYEVFGSYHDRMERTPAGWRIAERRMQVDIELGTRDVLGPGRPA